MSVDPLQWLLAASPVAALLGGILLLKWEASKAGALSWFIGIFAAYVFFGADARLLALANAKGIVVTLHVLLIIWSAIFLYNVVDGAGAVHVISGAMRRVSNDRETQCLLLAWCFSSLLQGIAGFGVPVAIVAPIMAGMGFDPLVSVAACLVGHSWAISFGSMGSSYNAIQLVTGLPGEVIGPSMAIVFSVAVFSTGYSVLHIQGGSASVRRGFPLVAVVGALMSFMLWFMNRVGVASLASLAAGMSGCAVLSAYALMKRGGASGGTAGAPGAIGVNEAALPYYAVVILTLCSQIAPVKRALRPHFWALDFPEVSTALGHMVEAAENYSKIQFFSHPAPILIVSAVFGAFFYASRGAGGGAFAQLASAGRKTVQKCVPTSVGIATMVMMALVMSDAGMTNCIARGAAGLFGHAYPLVSPFVGALGTFITGSNTNSNVMFGMMQYETAIVLGRSAVLMASAQSVGGSLGVSIAPSTILMGATNIGASGRENEILARTFRYGLLNIALVGVFVWFLGRLG